MPKIHNHNVMVALENIVKRCAGATVIENMERVSLYLPDELKVKLDARAEKNRRSLNAEITIILERCIDLEEVVRQKP